MSRNMYVGPVTIISSNRTRLRICVIRLVWTFIMHKECNDAIQNGSTLYICTCMPTQKTP